MNQEQAREIVSKCLQHVFFREGLRTEPPASLFEYSLRELLEANEQVSEERPRIAGGTQTIFMHCDPRLVAALYVAYHYEPEDPQDCNAVAYGPGSAVLVVKDHPAVIQDTTEEPHA